MARAIVAVVVVVGFLAIGGSVDSAVRVTVCRVDAEGGGQSLDAKGGKERVDVRALVALGPNVDPAVIFGNSVQRICRLGAEASRAAHVPIIIPAASGAAAQDLFAVFKSILVFALFASLLGIRLTVVCQCTVLVLDVQGLEVAQAFQHAFGRFVIERITQGRVDETGTVEAAVPNRAQTSLGIGVGVVAGGGGRHREDTEDELHDITSVSWYVGPRLELQGWAAR